MKNSKGLVQDTKPVDQPGGSYFFGKNGIARNYKEANENEEGFVIAAALLPYVPMGVVESDKHPIIFSTNNLNSAIGYYDLENDAYIPIIDDSLKTFLLGFSTDNYITGQAQRNYKGEVVCTFTDKVIFPMYINCDKPVANSLTDLVLFPIAVPPTITLVQDSGGSLLPGSYFAAVRLLKNDGTQTAFLVLSDPTIVAGVTGVQQNVSLVITLTNVDPNYDLAEIAIVQKVGGIFSAGLIEPLQLAPTTTVVYTGSNPTTDITLAEVLRNPVVYDRVGTMGQLNDYLYIGALHMIPEISMQKYVNMVQIRWASELHNVFPSDPVITSGNKKSFAHREVYALYMQFSLNTGGWSRAFTVPGRALLPADLIPSTEAQTQGESIPSYKVDDTIRSFDPFAKTGLMGAWQNIGEQYPNTDDYNSSDIGGEDLRGKNVRHHRFPSHRWCKNNLYSATAAYGKTALDILGLDISNVIIPTQYTGIITGWRILYAKRNLGNATVAAQGLYLNACRQAQESNKHIIGGDSNYISSGGNWGAKVDYDGDKNDKPISIDTRLLRFHAFDLLFSQPSISPSYIANELFHSRLNMEPAMMMEDGDTSGSGGKNGPICYLIDYLTDGTAPAATANGKVYRSIKSSTYVPANTLNGAWNNIRQETCFGMVLNGSAVMNYGQNPIDSSNPAVTDYSWHDLWVGREVYERPDKAVQFEKTMLTTLMFLRDNLYISFSSQSLVVGNSRVNGAGTARMFGGDMFINDYTFHTYGWQDANDGGWTIDGTPAGGGIRVARRFACEAASNINLRFETPGNIYSEWYPKEPLTKDDVTNYITQFKRTQDPNQFGYNKDLNALNELVSTAIFNPLVEVISDFPYRIHRGGKLGRLDKRRSWRTFDPLDFYEMEKDMGLLINLDGLDDRLLIHMEKCLFITQDKSQLAQNSGLNITLGAGDIFQFEPQPALGSKLGYGGTQHDLACYVTPMGYVFIDSAQGQIFVFKGNLQLMNEMINTTVRQFMRLTDKNIFTGNGYTVGYDPHYKRVIFTMKNQVLASGAAPIPYQPTPAFMATLVPGVSVVLKDGRAQRFLGVNNRPDISCVAPKVPSIGNYIISVVETTPAGTGILSVAGVNVDNVYITGGNTGSAFALTPGGKLTVAGPLSQAVIPQYVLQCKAVNNTSGLSVNFTITVNILAGNRPPITGDQTVHIPEGSPAGTLLTTVLGTSAKALTYTITNGNTGNAFTIDPATAVITVANPGPIDYETNPTFSLEVTVSDGTLSAIAIITVIVDFVNSPPSNQDVVITIPDTTPIGTEVVDLLVAVIDAGTIDGLQTMTFQLMNSSIPGVFDFTPQGAVTLAAALDARVVNQYTFQLVATNTGLPQLSSNFRLIINVTYDPATLEFRPANLSCGSGTCPAGYTLSADGLSCLKTTSVPATPPSGATITVGPASDVSYSNFGALIYHTGYALNGTGTIDQQVNAAPWNNPSGASSTIGPLNRAGVWGTTTVPANQPIGFSIPITLTSAKVYLVAIAGDNKVQIVLDGVTIVDQDPTAMGTAIGTWNPAYASQGIAVAFKFWHVYPVFLPAGTHYLGLQGVNFGGPAGFGAEIYDNTVAEFIAAIVDPAYLANPGTYPLASNFYTNLNLVFSTRMARGGIFTSGPNNAYTCPPGYGLDPTPPTPTCYHTDTIPATPNAAHWANVIIKSTFYNADVITLPNVANQNFQGITVPLYPDVVNSIHCSGSIQEYLNARKQGAIQKNNCLGGKTGSIVTYTVQKGKIMSLASQQDADSQADTDLANNLQAYANAHGTCSN